MFDMVFPDGVQRGLALDGHSDRAIFVTKNGSHLVEKDWVKMKRLAIDTPIKPFNGDLVRMKDTPEAFDAEHRLELLRRYLRGRGLSESDIEEAIEHARADLEKGEAVADELPVSGPGGMGGRMSKQSREGSEKIFQQQARAADNEADFLRRFPEAARVGGGTPAERPLTARDRKLAADRANSEASALRRFPERLGPGLRRTSGLLWGS